MTYYMGEKFDKETNKEYKKLDAAKKAAEKLKQAVFDEDGKMIDDHRKTEAETTERPESAILTDDVPEGALEEADGKIKTYDAAGKEAGEITVEAVKEVMKKMDDMVDGMEAVRISGKIRRVFDGAIRMRRLPSWDVGAVAGATTFTEKTVTHLLQVEGKPMYRTIDGYYISGNPELVEYMEG